MAKQKRPEPPPPGSSEAEAQQYLHEVMLYVSEKSPKLLDEVMLAVHMATISPPPRADVGLHSDLDEARNRAERSVTDAHMVDSIAREFETFDAAAHYYSEALGFCDWVNYFWKRPLGSHRERVTTKNHRP